MKTLEVSFIAKNWFKNLVEVPNNVSAEEFQKGLNKGSFLTSILGIQIFWVKESNSKKK
jgi:hypothetical protein